MKDQKFYGLTVSQIKAMADKVISMTLPEARALPGLRGKMWPTQLEFNGFIDVTQDGQKFFYELAR